jgi:putative transposase
VIKRHPHTPPHLYIDNTFYFLTGAIYQKRPLLGSPKMKNFLFERIQHYFDLYQWELHHWVILDNHYHLLGKSKYGTDLGIIMKGIHGSTSLVIRKKTNAEKPIWWNYWDYCPRDADDYFIRLNYLPETVTLRSNVL